MPNFCGEQRSSIFVCRQCISDGTALVVALDKGASVVRDAISLGSPEASITAYTLNPATLASSDENITQTLGRPLRRASSLIDARLWPGTRDARACASCVSVSRPVARTDLTSLRCPKRKCSLADLPGVDIRQGRGEAEASFSVGR
jgi:hypothetical protein